MENDIHPTKGAILEAAIKVFSEKGFKGATTKEIAQAAGIAEGTIFRHFSSKAAILYFIVDYYIPRLGVDSLAQTLSECQGMDRQSALRYLIQNRFDILLRGKELLRIILTEIQYDASLREIYLERVYRPILHILSTFFQSGMEKGDYRSANPQLIGNLLISYIVFFIGNQYYLDNVPDYQFNADAVTDILLNGIKGSDRNE